MTNATDCMKQFYFVAISLRVRLYDCHLNEPDSNSFSAAAFADVQSESLVDHQSVTVASGAHDTPVMRSVTRAPAFIQLESEDKLAWVEGVAKFGGRWIQACGGYGDARYAFHSIAGATIIGLISGKKPDKLATVWHAIFDAAISSTSNAFLVLRPPRLLPMHSSLPTWTIAILFFMASLNTNLTFFKKYWMLLLD